jgi:GT2 family glycosyltransferase
MADGQGGQRGQRHGWGHGTGPRSDSRAGPPHENHGDGRVSVVVLTHNRREWLRATLQRLRELPERPPVAVVDNGSEDGTAQMVRREFCDFALLRVPMNLGAAARNIGAAWAPTRYVAFCDDDTWWHPGALPMAADIMDGHPDVGALTARLLVMRDGGRLELDPTSVVMGFSPLPSDGLPGRAILGLLAGATIFRTCAFRAAGGYHPRLFIGGEETLLALDLAARGWHLIYAPQVLAYHHPCPIRSHRQRRRLMARNAIWSAWLRLPVGAALRETARTFPALLREGGLPGCFELARALPWIVRERAVIPASVEQMRRRVLDAEAMYRPGPDADFSL